MKTNYIKAGILLAGLLFAVFTAKAQTKSADKKADDTGRYYNHNVSTSPDGKRVESMRGEWGSKTYELKLVNDKITELYVDGQKIPAADWSKYDDAIAAFREQIKRDRIQAIRNQEQARLNQIQANKNHEQVARNQQQVRLNQIQEEKNQQQAVRNQQQAQLNQLQEEKNQQQVERNQEQASRNQQQAMRNQEQATRNEEQSRLNQIQAKKNQEQAEENERVMKQLIGDLVSDKIIPDENSLHSLTFDGYDMVVNGVKQPDAVYKKYAEKYTRFSHNSFSYSKDGTYYGK